MAGCYGGPPNPTRVFLLLLFVALTLADPPRNPYLAATPFPICHGDTWCSDSSPLSAFTSPTNVSAKLLFLPAHPLEVSDPISLVYAPDGLVWASSVSHIMRLEVTASSVTLVTQLAHNFSLQFHGAYSLVTADNTYYAADMDSISAYRLLQPSNPRSPFSRTLTLEVPGSVDGEHLVGLSITFDGFLVFATSAGRVGVVSRNLTGPVHVVQLPGRDMVLLPLHMVSNNFAVDQEGGVYVVTSMHQHRLQWTGQDLEISWSTQYSDGKDPWFYGRLGPGSGSSPTIVGPTGNAELVVITDGQTPMNIRFFSAASGAACGIGRVDFGGLGNSTSEQSVVVAGNKAMVVNNWWTGEGGKVCENATHNNEWIAHICPALLGEAAYGVAQFAVDPASCSVSLAWVNKEVSCTSAIPVVSLKSGIAYCLGKRRLMFTIEAIDWDTGVSLFHVPLGEGLQWNSLFAGTEIGADGDILMGTMAGVLHVV